MVLKVSILLFVHFNFLSSGHLSFVLEESIYWFPKKLLWYMISSANFPRHPIANDNFNLLKIKIQSVFLENNPFPFCQQYKAEREPHFMD